MKKLGLLLIPALFALSACDDNGNGGGGGGPIGGASCDLKIPMQVTGELTPQYAWDGGAVENLAITRVENLEYLSNAANATACATAMVPGSGTTRDERCKIAYARKSLPSPSAPTVARSLVTSPVMHGAPGDSSIPPNVTALTEEAPLVMGVAYQMSVTRVKSDGSVESCGCLRFNAGTAKSGDGSC